MIAVNFFEEDISFALSHPEETAQWIDHIISKEGYELNELNFIFCSDEYLHQINIEYLDHDTYTDIITFDNSESSNEIEGDIFISVDRVDDNAKMLDTSFEDELDRVIIHGVLHLLGMKDKTEEEAMAMRKKEEACLSLRKY